MIAKKNTSGAVIATEEKENNNNILDLRFLMSVYITKKNCKR